tara:strand:+ start:1675 stop:1908 length:234 start_codon:yes stop_codon:yes gene_type:complete
MITIKSKLNGFTRTVGEPEFNNMIDKADYEIVDTVKTENSTPDNTWTNAKIRDYLDSKNISYETKDNKATLLSKAGT